MKFEVKTEKDNYSNSFLGFLRIIFKLALLIIFCDIAVKLGNISRYHQIEYNCKLLSIEKSKPIFKELSRVSKLKSKQSIWEFCREVVK